MRTIAGQQRKTKRVQHAKSWQCETGTSAGELRAEPRAIRLVNHPFRLDSQLSATSQLLDKHASPNIGSNTSKFNNILEHDLFLYRLSHRRKPQLRLCPGETFSVSAAASRRHVDASLDLFARKSPRSLRDLAGKRALSARRLFLWMVGV